MDLLDNENKDLNIENLRLIRLMVVFFLTLLFVLVYFLDNNRFQMTPLLFLASVNLICAFIFIQYTKLNINKILLRFINVNILIIIILYFYMLTMVKNGGNYILVYKGLNEINLILSGLLIHLILSINKNKLNEVRLVGKFIVSISIIIILYFCYKCFFITLKVFFVTMCLLDIIIEITNLLIISKKNINFNYKKSKLYQLQVVSLYLFIIVDIFMLFTFNNKEVLGGFTLVRMIFFNLNIYIFTYSILIIGKNMLFKEHKEINMNLMDTNKAIDEKNKLLEEKKNEAIKLDSLYKEFLKFVDMPIIILDKTNNRIKYANNKFLELTNNKKIRNIINKKITDFLNIDVRLIAQLQKSTNTNLLTYTEYEDENIRVLEINLVYLSEYEIICIINDVTEKENMYKLKREIDEKRSDEKMKKNFLSNISHDLKTPIGVIYSASQLQDIYLKTKYDKEISKYNSICIDSCVYLNRLTNNIMDISRISERSLKAKLEVDNIVYFIEEKVNFINEAAKISNIGIVFDTEEEEVFVKFDKEFTERIILNLLSNAIKYSSKGSEVKVNVKVNGSHVLIEIVDFGVGMSEEFVGRAFDLYTMEDRDDDSKTKGEKGTGVGLYVVYNLVKLQNADITVESKTGVGSKFTISFLKEIGYE